MNLHVSCDFNKEHKVLDWYPTEFPILLIPHQIELAFWPALLDTSAAISAFRSSHFLDCPRGQRKFYTSA